VIVLDTSLLVDAVTESRGSAAAIRELLFQGEDLMLPSLVLFERFCGPRTPEDLSWQEELFPTECAIPFGVDEARVTADLYRAVSRARSRKFDLAIAACAIVRDVPLWTLNLPDFQDIPGLRLYSPDSA
jgi:predicted nucleic acid-binding protein